MAWRYLRRNRPEDPSMSELYLLGLAVHVAMLLWTLSLGWPVALGVLSKISLPVMLVCPVATALLGWLIVNQGMHKRAEAALRESEEKHRTLFETMAQGVVYQDVEGGIISANPAAERILALSLDQLLGRTSLDPRWRAIREDGSEFPGETHPSMVALRTGKEVRNVVMGVFNPQTDEYCWINIHAVPQFRPGQDAPYQVYATFADITARKRAEEAFKESEEKYRDLYENAPNTYLSVSAADGSILNCNKAASRVSGYDRETLLGMKAIDLCADTPDGLAKAKGFFKGFQEGKPFRDVELQMKHQDGHTFWVSLFVEPIKDHEGNIIETGVMATDISERKTLEAQFQQAQRMESVGTLAGGIAHDFNNLLMAVNGYTELLLMDKQEGEPDYQKLKAIEKAGERGAQLVRKLLAFSRKVEAERRPVDINQVVRQVRNILKMTIPKMIKIELHLAADLKTVSADPGQIEQVLMNLGTNARDAMPERGRLVIETENVTIDEEYSRMHPGAVPGNYVLLTVSDTGHGMDKETVAHIFDPFFTTKDIGKGTGLGLASVYGLVKIHGGYIMCYSEVGQGATFKIYLPVVEQITEPSAPGPMAAPLAGGTGTILVADDEEPIRDLAGRMLGRFGYKVILASSGEEALEVYSERKDQIDLVILDIGMPGMGGHQCLKELLRLDRNIKVIIASGYSPNGQVQETLESDAAGFAAKPYQLTDLLKTVQQVLGKEKE